MGIYRGSITSEKSCIRDCALIDRYYEFHSLEYFSLGKALISFLIPFINCCTGLYWDGVMVFSGMIALKQIVEYLCCNLFILIG